MASETLVWHGGPHTVVELDRDVVAGDEVVVKDRALRDRLLAADGFTLKDGSNPLLADPEPLASRKELEAQAEKLGLAVYPTEEPEDLAIRVRAAGGNPTKGAAKATADDGKLTPKQEAVARAEELGVGTSGTEKEIRKRIAAEEERLAQDQGGSTGGGEG